MLGKYPYVKGSVYLFPVLIYMPTTMTQGKPTYPLPRAAV